MPGNARVMSLPVKVYEVDPLVCPKYVGEYEVQFGERETPAVRLCRTAVIAITEDLDEIKHILQHLEKNGRSLPGFDPDRLN